MCRQEFEIFLFGIVVSGECVMSAVCPLGHWVPLLIHNRVGGISFFLFKKGTGYPPAPFGKLLFSLFFVSKYPLPFYLIFLLILCLAGLVDEAQSRFIENPSVHLVKRVVCPPSPPSKSGFAWNEWVLQAQLHQRSLCNDINGPLNLVSSVLFILTIFANNCMLFWRSIFYNPAFPPQQPQLFSLHFHPLLSLSLQLPISPAGVSLRHIALKCLSPKSWAELTRDRTSAGELVCWVLDLSAEGLSSSRTGSQMSYDKSAHRSALSSENCLLQLAKALQGLRLQPRIELGVLQAK